MLKEVMKQLKVSILFLIFFTLLTGLVYPFVVTGIAQLIFPWQANGSLIKNSGSILIGQSFNSTNYFWGRPSATLPYPYNAANSSGSNMGPSNPSFLASVQERVKRLQQSDATGHHLIPVDLVTASGSGLDPDISPLAAFYQVARIAKANHLPENEIENIINHLIKNRTLAILGEPRVNVLELNMALDQLRSAHGRATTQSR